MSERLFGHPPGVRVGDLFIDRMDLHRARVHLPTQPGISGTGKEGADSVVLSGGYWDDIDRGDYIIYTGAGGKSGSRHVADQDPAQSGNAGLITSFAKGLPVRVSRGSKWDSPYSPPAGYQYAGLYLVTDYWKQVMPEHGFVVLRFRLERIPEQDVFVTRVPTEPDLAFATSTISRRIRDTALTRTVKTMYRNACQICATRIDGVRERVYSEGAHVKPLGRPHLGADLLNNILCLCPNHHVQLDIGGIVIDDDFTIASTNTGTAVGDLTFVKAHRLDLASVQYHRSLWLSA